MERYLIYKIGLAILFYAVYFRKCAGADIDPNDLMFYQGVHGKPGVDFPTFAHIPRTTFSCKEVDSGYYADLETDCQVFHICNEGTKISFLCPNGTIFQQSDLICDWWFKVNCTTSPELYEESAEHLREELIKKKASRRVTNNDNRRMDFNSREDKQQKNNNFGRSNSKDTRHRNSEETQVPQETASFVRDSYFNKNNIRHSQKYPNHRTTYSDLKDPKYFSKNSLDVSSTTSSSIKPEIVVKQVAPINNGKPFTATTVEGIYDSNNRFQKGLKAKLPENVTQKYRAATKTSSNSLSSQNKKQTTIYINTKSNSNNPTTIINPTTKSYPATNNYPTTKIYSTFKTNQPPKTTTTYNSYKNKDNAFYQTTQSNPTNKPLIHKYAITTPEPIDTTTTEPSIIRIALTNKQRELSDLTPNAGGRNSNIFRIEPLPTVPSHHKTTVDDQRFTTTLQSVPEVPNYDSDRQAKTLFNKVQSTPDTITTKSSPNLKPKPFELPSITSPTSSTPEDTFYYKIENDKITNVPKYKVSSPSPFISSPKLATTPAPSTTIFTTTVAPTEATVSQNLYTQTYENVNNMITTLMDFTHDRQDKENNFDYQRPDLIIPPSVGPQTLHTLAVYFANALDGIAPANSGFSDNIPTERYDESDEIGLLSQTTVQKYNDLFKHRTQEEIENAMIQMLSEQENNSGDKEDLATENSKHAFDSPNVRQLAKVFTEALSAYLDDPVGFKKDLEKVRPTDPPISTKDPYLGEDDEVLNFSDADIANRDHFPPYTTPTTPSFRDSATWGYILALNNSSDDENAINTVGENLHRSNSQYYSPISNNLVRKPKLNSAFATNNAVSNTGKNQQNEEKVSTTSLISLFNTQLPPERPANAERQQQFESTTSTPNANGNYDRLIQSTVTSKTTYFTNPTPSVTQRNTYLNDNLFYNISNSGQETTPTDIKFNAISTTSPTFTTFEDKRTTFNFRTTYSTLGTEQRETNQDFTNSFLPSTTESAVAKLFNYFERRVTPPTSRNLYTESPSTQPNQRTSYNLPTTYRTEKPTTYIYSTQKPQQNFPTHSTNFNALENTQPTYTNYQSPTTASPLNLQSFSNQENSFSISTNKYSDEKQKNSGAQNKFSGDENKYSTEQNIYSGQQNKFSENQNKFVDEQNKFASQSNGIANQKNKFPAQNDFSGQEKQFSNQNSFSGQQNSFAAQQQKYQSQNDFPEQQNKFSPQNTASEQQNNLFSDITRLNNLANIATSEGTFPYNGQNSNSNFGINNQRTGKFIDNKPTSSSPQNSQTTNTPYSNTVTPTEYKTYIPHNHKSKVYNTEPTSPTYNTENPSIATRNPFKSEALPLSNPNSNPTKITTINDQGRSLQTSKDVEERFTSLVNKATTILSSLHNIKIQPQGYQQVFSKNGSPNDLSTSKATESSLTGNTANLPDNHWTTSSDATKLWRTTLYVNPATVNQKLNATHETTLETTTKSLQDQAYEDISYEGTIPTTYSEIEYDLQALPKLELNSTQVHGVLIDFINSTMKQEHKLERFLKKLNTTEDEFLKKMKEIEKNPLTRRLILLLISECNKEKEQPKGSSRQAKELFSVETTPNTPGQNPYRNIDFVQLPLGNEDQDARALDLLNSLYSIASKYGK